MEDFFDRVSRALKNQLHDLIDANVALLSLKH